MDHFALLLVTCVLLAAPPELPVPLVRLLLMESLAFHAQQTIFVLLESHKQDAHLATHQLVVLEFA
jgi:hypothetical protein